MSLWPLSPGPLSGRALSVESYSLREFLFNLPLAYSLTSEVLDLNSQTARSTDYVLLIPETYGLAGQVSRGHIICLVNSGSFLFDVASRIPSHCEYLCLQDDIQIEQVRSLRLMADLYHKKIAVSPESSQSLADDAQLITQIAPYTHLLIIQAGPWLAEDASPSLDTFLERVHTVASAARAANPEILVQVQLGIPVPHMELSADLFFRGISRLADTYPQDLASCFISRVDAWDNPEKGNNLLVQALTFLRGESYSPAGAPPTPKDFRAAGLAPTGVLLSWTDASSEERGYLLKREQAPDRPPALVAGQPFPPDMISYQDIVPAEGSYYYFLCAFNANGLSLFSPMAAVETGGGKPDLPPQILSLPATAAIRGVPFEYAVSASDPDGEAVTYSLSIHPAGMTIDDATGLITWLPATAGWHIVSLTVTDGLSAACQWFEVEVKTAD